jgi:hypothetical protein
VKNWKTTTTGVIGMVMAVLGIVLKLLQGETIDGSDMAIIGAVISNGVGLFNAKDAATPQTVVTQPMQPAGPTKIETTL